MFHSNISIQELPPGPNIVMKNSYLLDQEATLRTYKISYEREPNQQWFNLLMGSDLIINDIESYHNPVALELKIPVVNISNFTYPF